MEGPGRPQPMGSQSRTRLSDFACYPRIPQTSSFAEVFLHTTALKAKVTQSCLTSRLHGLYSPWNSLGQNTGVGSPSLLLGIFPTQRSNPGLPHCRQILYKLSHKGSTTALRNTIYFDNHFLSYVWNHYSFEIPFFFMYLTAILWLKCFSFFFLYKCVCLCLDVCGCHFNENVNFCSRVIFSNTTHIPNISHFRSNKPFPFSSLN